jgi:hypothetical protein
MTQQMVPFEAKGLPAHIANLPGISEDDLISGTGGGFPVISIKGKVFTIVRGDERTMVTRPDADGEPAGSIEVVILRANPNLSKTYYPKGYEEGTADKPTCYSNDGIAPGQDAQEPQSVKCATCAHNQWGSKISENGSKVKACSDVRRLAVAPLNQLNDPMLIRVPAASLKPLGEYGSALKKRGVKYPAVVTKISFDFSVAHPALVFKPVAFITEDMATQVQEVMKSDMVTQIIGLGATPAPAPVAIAAPQKAPAEGDKPQPSGVVPAAVAAPKTEPKPTAKKANGKTAAFGNSDPVPAAKPAAPSVQVSKIVEVDASGLEADLDRVLSAAGFDDKT